MAPATSPAVALTAVLVGASLLQLAAPFRFQFGIPGLQADFAANLGGSVAGIGSAISNLGLFGGARSGASDSSASSSVSASSQASWPWSRLVGQRQDTTTVAAMTEDTANAVNGVAGDAQGAQAAQGAQDGGGGGGFGLWNLYGIPFAGGAASSGVRGDAGAGSPAPEDGIIFSLFTRRHKEAVRLFARDASTISGSTFNPKRKTKMVIHGFTSNAKESSAADLLKDIFLRTSDVNVILVDWHGVDPHIYPLDVSNTVPMVGAAVADLIKALVSAAGADEDDVHLIGHSLGAHVAGAAGAIALGPMSKGAITGLDPAGPLYENAEEAHRLDPSDAAFVEAVHLDGGFLGIVQPVGHVDWYINTGMHRHMDCGADIMGLCTHCFAFEVFAHALTNKRDLVGTKCGSLDQYLSGGCQGNQRLAMNLGISRKSRGMFFVDTKLRPSAGLRGIGSRFISPIISQISKYIAPRPTANDPALRC